MEWRELQEMTTDEKIEEALTILRSLSDALEALADNPMVSAMIGA